MTTKSSLLQACLCVLGMLCLVFRGQAHGGLTLPTADAPPSKLAEAIPWSQLGARAAANYTGDGLTVSPTEGGARLYCVFQQLEGQATTEGLRLVSTVDGAKHGRFRVVASSLGRDTPGAPGKVERTSNMQHATPNIQLNAVGTLKVDGQTVRFIRPEVIEEYSVSVDGVRQDFVVMQKPEGTGQLRLELDVTGASAEQLANGARLVLGGSWRKIAYGQVRVTDATGKALSARMEVVERNSNVAPARPIPVPPRGERVSAGLWGGGGKILVCSAAGRGGGGRAGRVSHSH